MRPEKNADPQQNDSGNSFHWKSFILVLVFQVDSNDEEYDCIYAIGRKKQGFVKYGFMRKHIVTKIYIEHDENNTFPSE
jgi:hypothetical protein